LKIHLAVIEQHAVDVVNCTLRGLLGLVVDEPVSLATILIHGNLATQDITKGGKGVVKRLGIDGRVQILDKDVSDGSSTDSTITWVTLRPHDANWSTLDWDIVQCVKSTFTISLVVEVHVRVSEGARSEKGRETNRRVTASRQTRIEATGPIWLKVSNKIASVMLGSSSPT
jgi:hypothetical protein